jgi:hypothetical protein
MKAWWLLLTSRSSSDSATTGSGNRRYQSAGARLDADQRFAGAVGDELAEVVGLGCDELAHAEVVQDQDAGAGELGEALVPGEIGAAAGQVDDKFEVLYAEGTPWVYDVKAWQSVAASEAFASRRS